MDLKGKRLITVGLCRKSQAEHPFWHKVWGYPLLLHLRLNVGLVPQISGNLSVYITGPMRGSPIQG